ncbi:MAG TPA: glycoside hydrolase family 95 protein, partial [Duganella sp.]|nr:glycoside hydrolase family 95 protein [Duganella sp.]
MNKKTSGLDNGMSPGRRQLMVSAGLAMAFPGLAGATVVATTATSGRENLELWYQRPAGAWVEALPVGNGRLGAMCFGRVAQERIQLNEDTLFAGGPYDPNNPRSLEALPAIRALVDQGEFGKAADMIASSMMAKPLQQMPYGAAGDLLLDFQGMSGADNYQRSLELDTAIATTRFADGKARHVREVFSSAPDQVIVIRLTAQGGTLNFDLGYRHPADAKYGDTDYDGHQKAAASIGVPWDYREPPRAGRPPSTLSVRADGGDALLIDGRNIASSGIPAALRYAVRVKVLGDGAITPRGDRIEVRG